LNFILLVNLPVVDTFFNGCKRREREVMRLVQLEERCVKNPNAEITIKISFIWIYKY